MRLVLGALGNWESDPTPAAETQGLAVVKLTGPEGQQDKASPFSLLQALLSPPPGTRGGQHPRRS